MNLLRDKAAGLLEPAGVSLDGDEPWDVQVHDERLFRRAFVQGTLGLGEAYMDGWWDVEQLDVFFERVQDAQVGQAFSTSLPALLMAAKSRLLNLQSHMRAFRIGEHHYDIGNELYEAMLDPTMTYSCGYWADAKDLAQAQRAKLDLACRKVGLEPGMRLLDIGCGWGGLLQHAAEHYGVEGVGLTVSKEQARLARERCDGLPVDIRLQDYRELNGGEERFDRIISIGMFEHVGPKNYEAYFETCQHLLERPGDLMLLHTIGSRETDVNTDPWIERYIFPNSTLPSLVQITQAAEGRFDIEDVHNFGQDYDPTLMAWHANVEDAWHELAAEHPDKYDERFRRMWRYYLLSSAGTFRARRLNLWQLVLARDRGVIGGYTPVR